MIVTCAACTKDFEATKEHITEQYLPDRPAVTDYGLTCPHCQHRTHTHYLDGRLRAMQADVRTALQDFQARPTDAKWQRYQKMREKFQVEFDRLNPKPEVQ